jgi:hypothetical protein
VRIERHLAVEQSLADHVGGERPGLLHHLHRLAALSELGPVIHLAADGGQEVGNVLGEHVGVERRLLRHADLLPQRPVVRDHRLAEDRLQPIEIFDVVVRLGDEHALEVLGLGEQHHTLIAHIDRNDPAIALRHLHQDRQRVAGPLEQRGERKPDGRFLAQLIDVGKRCGHFGSGLRSNSLRRQSTQTSREQHALPSRSPPLFTRISHRRSHSCSPRRNCIDW